MSLYDPCLICLSPTETLCVGCPGGVDMPRHVPTILRTQIIQGGSLVEEVGAEEAGALYRLVVAPLVYARLVA